MSMCETNRRVLRATGHEKEEGSDGFTSTAKQLSCWTTIGRGVVLAVLSLSPSPNIFAQQAADTNETAAPAVTEENTKSEAPEPIAASADQKESELDDYEASEQISEDLSVSFPVDI
ncbi:MAG: hypothetical protein AAF098_08065 [Pseudomonadota bacterium]